MSLVCGGCTACCQRDVVRLDPHELNRFEWEMVSGAPALKRKEDGSCAHLTPRGCGIYDTRPGICRRFDCRVLFNQTPKARRRIRIMQNPTMKQVYDAGKKRLGTLEGATA